MPYASQYYARTNTRDWRHISSCSGTEDLKGQGASEHRIFQQADTALSHSAKLPNTALQNIYRIPLFLGTRTIDGKYNPCRNQRVNRNIFWKRSAETTVAFLSRPSANCTRRCYEPLTGFAKKQRISVFRNSFTIIGRPAGDGIAVVLSKSNCLSDFNNKTLVPTISMLSW